MTRCTHLAIYAGTKTFALIVDDADAPKGEGTHWIVYNIPEENAVMEEEISSGDGISKVSEVLTTKPPPSPPGQEGGPSGMPGMEGTTRQPGWLELPELRNCPIDFDGLHVYATGINMDMMGGAGGMMGGAGGAPEMPDRCVHPIKIDTLVLLLDALDSPALLVAGTFCLALLQQRLVEKYACGPGWGGHVTHICG